MRIQHNIAALNSYRQLSGNNSAVSKNLEKLSSGYRINRAGDDAAGLAISEKMRAQITGLKTAQKNANDGISLVQTAEGALTEVHSMLNRMIELADQSANGTYDDKTDRANLQKEVKSLLDEVDRISAGTNFNGINLLDGSLGGGATKTGTVEADLSKLGIDITANAADIAAVKGQYKTNDLIGTKLSMGNKGDSYTFTMKFTDAEGKEQEITKTLVMKDPTSNQGLVLDDGSEDGVKLGIANLANVGEVTQAELAGAVAAALSKDDTIKANFDVVADGNALKFTAREGGSEGAVLNSITSASTVKTTGVTTPYATMVNVEKKPADATKAYNFANAKVWNNDGNYAAGEKNLEDAIFEVNGKKFAFVNGSLTEENLAALKEAGVEHWVKLGTSNAAPAVADVTAMAEKIAKETGLVVEQGASGAGAWTPGTGGTQTEVVFKNSTLTSSTEGKGLVLQIGDTADDFNQLTVSVGNMNAKSLGIAGVDISTREGAQNAITSIKDAINSVSSTRGDLGAIQNRLEHTINNLSVTTENMTAAESRIRDVDMADEMMSYTKNNILVQAAQAMLAQANQVPQGVLQLLQ